MSHMQYMPPGKSLAAAYRSYGAGFMISLICSSAAYMIANHQSGGFRVRVAAVVLLALIQFGAQLFFFLHLGAEQRPKWRLAVFALMLIVVGILVGGTLWIMYNLSYRMSSYPSPQQINTYMSNQNDGL